MSGSASDLEIILGAKDFSDFVDKMTLVQTLSSYDKDLIDDVNEQLSKISVQKEELETDKDELEEKQTTLQEDQQELNDLLEENEEFLRNLYQSSEDAKKAIEGAAIESADAESKIAAYYEAQKQKAALEAQAIAESLAAEKAKALEQASKKTEKTEEKATEPQEEPEEETKPADSGSDESDDSSGYTPAIPASGYTWPTPGYYWVISKWNEDRGSYNHGAIDITGSGIMGALVVAAQSGTVIDTYNSCPHNYGKSGSCGCNGGFGNYVVIDHGNGKSTLYAHLTNGIVSPGQTVSQGQVIGFVGSTGWSTGAHLHFETRYYGVRYNPHDEYPNMDF
ncbi:MAG: peptidoglycan DD-metalloendopeptidase family protein [Ruminococcus sp.]|nr:peptidoglycan DD-metalloendopeptidase family protein [Ruminococcus sp.]